MIRILVFCAALATFVAITACSSGSYKTQSYAKLSNTKDFEDEYPVVWKGVLAALSEYKIENQEEEDGLVETDWVYSTSNDKYHEYRINGFPRKKYLQTRYKFSVHLEKRVGGVKVTVEPEEEIETLRDDGSSEGWRSVSEPDTARANEMIRNIELKILSRPN